MGLISPWDRIRCAGDRGLLVLGVGCSLLLHVALCVGAEPGGVIDASRLRGKVMCGYQAWFRCPGDGSELGWVHWSRDSRRIAPQTLSFDLWPDMTEYSPEERYPAPGFTLPNGEAATLFSSANPRTILRHFEWMRDYGIDGAWLQHFVVDLPDGPMQGRYPSRRKVVQEVAASAARTGRVWALTYDTAGMPAERIFEVLTTDWKKMVDEQVVSHPRYLHEGKLPVVEVWGFYRDAAGNAMTAEVGHRLIDFFKTPGPYAAYFVGGGDWSWRRNADPAWQSLYRRCDAYMPWNIGNTSSDKAGVKHASTGMWEEDQRECARNNVLWIPTVYPGFSWDHLKRRPAGTTGIPRRGGKFLWEQFHTLGELDADTVFVAMFDEVDEGTAILKVTSSPPTESDFIGYEGLPSDWYLRLVGEGTRMIRKQRPLTRELPFEAQPVNP